MKKGDPCPQIQSRLLPFSFPVDLHFAELTPKSMRTLLDPLKTPSWPSPLNEVRGFQVILQEREGQNEKTTKDSQSRIRA
jgi:hypothetical protein